MRIGLFDGVFSLFSLLAEKRLLRQKPAFEPRAKFEAGPEGAFEREKQDIQKEQEELVNFIQDKDEFDHLVFRDDKDLSVEGISWEDRGSYREFLKKMKTLSAKISGMTLPRNFQWHDVFPPKAVWDRSHKNIIFLRYDEMKKTIEVLMLEDIRRGIEAEVRRPGFDPKKPTPMLAGYFDLLMQTLRPLRERKAALEKRETLCDRIDTKIENRIDVGSEWMKLHFLLRDIQKDVEALRVSGKETPEEAEAWSKKLAEQEEKTKSVLLPKLQQIYKEIFGLFKQIGSPIGEQERIRQYARNLSEFTVPAKNPDALRLRLREVSRMIEELRYYSTGQVRSLTLKTEFDIADVEGELFYRWLFRASDRGEGTYVALHQHDKGHIEFVNESPIEDAQKRIQSINALAARSPDAKSKEPVLETHPQSDPLIRTQLEVLAAKIWRIADCDRTSMFEAGQKVFRGIDDTRSVVHLRNAISPFHIEDRILRKATTFLNLRKIREMQDLLHHFGDDMLPGVSQAFRPDDVLEEKKRQKNLIEAEFGVMLNDSLNILQKMEDTIISAIGKKKFLEAFPDWVAFRDALKKEVEFIRSERKEDGEDPTNVTVERLEKWRKLLRETLFFFRCTLAIHFPSLRMSPSRESEIRSWRDRWNNHHIKEVKVLDIMWQTAGNHLFWIGPQLNQSLPDYLKEGEERKKEVMIMDWVNREIHDYFNAEANKAGSTGPFLSDREALPKIIKLNKILDHLQERISCRREFIAQSLLARNGEPRSIVDYPEKGAVYRVYYASEGSCFKFLVHSQEEGPGGKPR